MEEVFRILRELESTSSRNAKKDILKRNQDNELLKKFFLYAYDPRKIYGIGSKSIKRKDIVKAAAPSSKGIIQKSLFTSRTSCGYKDIFELLNELVKHPFGSNADVSAVNEFLSRQDDEAYYWYTRLILKDLKIGCTAATINEVYNNYIPSFEVMLAYPYQKHTDKIVGEFQLQKKIDGFRLIVYHHPDGTLQFFTRNGLELFNFPEIEKDFKYVPKYPVTMVYDGECIANDTFNDTQKLIMKNGPKTGLVYNIFDVITFDEWEREESFDPLFTRYDLLNSIMNNTVRNAALNNELICNIQLVEELYRGSDIVEITKWFDYARSQGWEGIMVKMNTPYVRKRTTNMLKVKEFDTLDLRVLRVNEGTGKYAGKLGSVTVDFEGTEVDVGSGFDDYARERFWKEPNLIVDKIIEVQYFERTTNRDGRVSLRFPIFIRVREDK